MRHLAVLSLLAGLIVAAPAPAATLRPLRTDLPPRTFAARVPDAVLPAGARAARSQRRVLRTPGGENVHVEVSGRYGGGIQNAQGYVDFLGTLPHGSELRRLRVFLAPPDEVRSLCGGDRHAFAACYRPSRNEMIVPGREIIAESGISTAYAITHEYGHHVASHRDARPFVAVRSGPRYWSSHERVCSRVAAGRLGRGYLSSPGENWAEVYARLRWPSQPWRYDPALAPSRGALAAARRDVLAPWTAPRGATLGGTLSPSAPRRAFAVRLRLDGRVSASLHAPRGADFRVAIADGRRVLARGRRRASLTACRARAVETVQVVVTRHRGSGAFTLRTSVPG